MTEMILNFIETSIYVGLSMAFFLTLFYMLTKLNKVTISRRFLKKGIKLKCIKWKPFASTGFTLCNLINRRFYLVEYIKKDGRVSKTRLKSVFFI
ncbi:MAG: hypothetical protein WCY75_00400 [Sulfurimonadaceae bacterium]